MFISSERSWIWHLVKSVETDTWSTSIWAWHEKITRDPPIALEPSIFKNFGLWPPTFQDKIRYDKIRYHKILNISPEYNIFGGNFVLVSGYYDF